MFINFFSYLEFQIINSNEKIRMSLRVSVLCRSHARTRLEELVEH